MEDRDFVSSSLVELETLPNAEFHKFTEQVEWYRHFFATQVEEFVTVTEDIVQEAISISSTQGVKNIDALHLACAVATGVVEFVTLEDKAKRMHGERRVKVRHLADCFS